MVKQNEIKVLLMANVHGGNLHHPDTEAIKGRCIRTNFHHYILKCIKCIYITKKLLFNRFLYIWHLFCRGSLWRHCLFIFPVRNKFTFFVITVYMAFNIFKSTSTSLFTGVTLISCATLFKIRRYQRPI